MCLTVVSQWDVTLHSSTAAPQLRSPPPQGPPCRVQMALGVLQTPPMEELPQQ